jgi:hypothetical protein
LFKPVTDACWRLRDIDVRKLDLNAMDRVAMMGERLADLNSLRKFSPGASDDLSEPWNVRFTRKDVDILRGSWRSMDRERHTTADCVVDRRCIECGSERDHFGEQIHALIVGQVAIAVRMLGHALDSVAGQSRCLKPLRQHQDHEQLRARCDYGHKLCLAAGASRLITDCRVEKGNPADSTLAVEPSSAICPRPASTPVGSLDGRTERTARADETRRGCACTGSPPLHRARPLNQPAPCRERGYSRSGCSR